MNRDKRFEAYILTLNYKLKSDTFGMIFKNEPDNDDFELDW